MRKTRKSSNSESLIPKDRLSKEIGRILEERELTQTEAAALLAVARRRVEQGARIGGAPCPADRDVEELRQEIGKLVDALGPREPRPRLTVDRLFPA